MEWLDDKVFTLIALYEASPCLYEVKCDDFNNRTKKRKMIEVIAKELNTTASEVTKKLKYLRSYYVDELRRASKHKGAEDMYTPKWKFFQALSFLSPYVNMKPKTLSNLNVETTETSTVNVEDTHELSLEDSLMADGTSLSDTTSNDSSMTREDRHYNPSLNVNANKSKRHKSSRDFAVSSLEILQQYLKAKVDRIHNQSTHQISTEEDETVRFGKLVGAELKTIRSVATKVALKRKIMDLIYDAQSEEACALEKQNQAPERQSNVLSNDRSITMVPSENSSCDDNVLV